MVEPAEREPTMEEIVVALRETGRGAGRMPPFTVVGGQPGGSQPAAAVSDAQTGTAGAAEAAGPDGSTAIADLRDIEIARLLAENAGLNERVVFLLKVIEREQARNAGRADHPAIEPDHGAIFHDVSAALEAEIRPVMLVLLRLLQRQRDEPAGPDARRAGREPARPAAPEAVSLDADGIVDFDAPRT
jgi:hypothetical protein